MRVIDDFYGLWDNNPADTICEISLLDELTVIFFIVVKYIPIVLLFPGNIATQNVTHFN